MDLAVLNSIADRIIAREGGVADVQDGKGVTRWGQTAAWLEQYQLPQPQTSADAKKNYLTVWLATKLAGIAAVDDLLADAVLDYAVNAGERVSIRTLQVVLDVSPDANWGPATQTAVDNCDRHQVAAKLLAEQVAHYGAIITANPSRSVFAHGWLNRKAEQIARL